MRIKSTSRQLFQNDTELDYSTPEVTDRFDRQRNYHKRSMTPEKIDLDNLKVEDLDY